MQMILVEYNVILEVNKGNENLRSYVDIVFLENKVFLEFNVHGGGE